MTLMEAIHQIDALKHNTCTYAQKVTWLSQLDALTKTMILDAGKAAKTVFSGYDETTPADTPLLIGAPFEEVYRYWLEARIDYANGEFTRYNNANAMFQTVWQRFADHHLRTAAASKENNRFH